MTQGVGLRGSGLRKNNGKNNSNKNRNIDLSNTTYIMEYQMEKKMDECRVQCSGCKSCLWELYTSQIGSKRPMNLHVNHTLTPNSRGATSIREGEMGETP